MLPTDPAGLAEASMGVIKFRFTPQPNRCGASAPLQQGAAPGHGDQSRVIGSPTTKRLGDDEIGLNFSDSPSFSRSSPHPVPTTPGCPWVTWCLAASPISLNRRRTRVLLQWPLAIHCVVDLGPFLPALAFHPSSELSHRAGRTRISVIGPRATLFARPAERTAASWGGQGSPRFARKSHLR
jgi:hypothetical protein